MRVRLARRHGELVMSTLVFVPRLNLVFSGPNVWEQLFDLLLCRLSDFCQDIGEKALWIDAIPLAAGDEEE